MSVLFKALQKAEKENEQRQTLTAGRGFDAERLAGSGAITSGGSRSGNMRWAAISGTAVLAAGIIAGVLFLQPQEQPRPQVATLTPPPAGMKAAPAPQAAPDAAAQAMATAAAVPPATASASAPVAAASEAKVAEAAPVATVAVAPAPAVQAPVAQAPAVQAPTAVAPVPAAPLPAIAPPAAPVAAAPPVETAIAAVQAAPPAPRVAAPKPAEKPVVIPPGSPAQALNPPIAVSRAEFALSGVGNAVQVRQISQDARDNVGAGYNALLRGEYDTALGFYDRALEKEPTSVLALLGRGASLQKLHKLEDAQAAYDKALKSDPQNREALTNITTIIGERAPEEALARLIELEKIYPAFSPIKAQIGLLYAKAGNMEPALDYLRRAIGLNPDAAMYQYNLALVLDHMGMSEQAVAAYQQVLSAIAAGRAGPELSSTEIERRLRYLRVK